MPFVSHPIAHGRLSVYRLQDTGSKYLIWLCFKGNYRSRRQSCPSQRHGFGPFLNNKNSVSRFSIWFPLNRRWHALFQQTPLSILIIQVGFFRRGLQCYWITFVLGLLWETTSGLTACGDTEALMTFPTHSRPTTHLSRASFWNLEI